MAHSLILGQTESGKSLLAKILAKGLISQGKKVVVYDPIYDPKWVATFKSSDPNEVSDYLRDETECFAFIDESGEAFGEGRDTSLHWLATRSRHYGHSVIFMGQRAIQVPRTMRDQCTSLYLFTSAKEDGKILSMEWNKDVLLNCNALPQFHFYKVSRFSDVQLFRIVDYTSVVPCSGNKPSGRSATIDIARSDGSDDRGAAVRHRSDREKGGETTNGRASIPRKVDENGKDRRTK